MDLLYNMGKIFTNSSDNNKNKKKVLIKNPKPLGKNIYTSDQSDWIENSLENKASIKTRKSKFPGKTGVIPNHYNKINSKEARIPIKDYNKNQTIFEGFNSVSSDSDFSDEELSNSDCQSKVSDYSVSLDFKNPTCFLDRCNQIIDNKKYENKIVDSGGVDKNTFLTQFDDLRFNNPNGPVSSNAVPNIKGHKSGEQRYEIERDLFLKGGFSDFNQKKDMIYDVVDKKNFGVQHLKPSFRSGKGYGMDPYHEEKMREVNQRKMEFFTGSANDVAYRPKVERRPLFNPVMGYTNIYGSPVMTNFYEKRYVPTRERRNELPFQPIRVTPGLGLGYNENSRQGYQDLYRVLPKTVDELRTANNPKITYGNVIVPGMKGSRGPVPSKVYKRRPMTFREYGPEWLIKGVGDYRAQAIHGDFDPASMATVNRGVTPLNYVGPAGNNEISKVKAENFCDVPNMTMRNIHTRTDRAGAAMGNSQIDKNKSFNPNDIPDMTMRNIYTRTDRAGAAMGNQQFDKVAAQNFCDIPNMTQREIYSKTDRAGTGLGNQQFDKVKAQNFNDIPDMTQREMYSKTDRAGKGMGNQQFDKVRAENFCDIPDMTQREMYSKRDRAAAGMGNQQFDKVKAQNFCDIPDMTQREMYSKTDRAGKGMGNQQFDKVKAQNFNDIPDMTQREMYSKTDRAGKSMGNQQFDKVKAQNFCDIPDMTQREIYSKRDRAAAGMGNQQFDKVKAQNFCDIPDMTQRELYSKRDRAAAGMGNQQFDKVKAQNFCDIPDMTQREMYSKTDRAGKGMGNQQFNKVKAQNFCDIPNMTQREMYSKTDRAGKGMGNQQFNKVKAQDFSDIPDITQREMYSKTDRAGAGMGNKQFNKVKAQDFCDIPDVTQREMYIKKDRAGNIGNVQFSKAIAENFCDIPDMTQREMYIRKDRAGNVHNSQFDKTRTRDDINNMYVNIINEEVARGREPTLSNYQKGPVADFTILQQCENVQINRDLYPDIQDFSFDRLESISTQTPILPPIENWNFDSYVEDNLEGNPYINNIIHKSPT